MTFLYDKQKELLAKLPSDLKPAFEAAFNEGNADLHYWMRQAQGHENELKELDDTVMAEIHELYTPQEFHDYKIARRKRQAMELE